MFPLFGAVQNYAWGKPASESRVAHLARHACMPDAAMDPQTEPNKPFAELWFGTHPNGPGMLCQSSEPSVVALSQFIAECPEQALGPVAAGSKPDLPFILKVLSVNKALSIQAHPNLELAARLHAERPDVYKDANHKPEMAVALTPFSALCCFRPLDELTGNLTGYPELAACIEPAALAAFLAAPSADRLRPVFGSLMRAEPGLVTAQLAALVARLEAGAAPLVGDALLVHTLHEQYPGDVGVFCALLLNHVVLEPGQAVFLAANLPHAYLSGDCIECMARSDNVVRAGLTPKLKDVDTLLAMLDYTPGKPAVLQGDDGPGAQFRAYVPSIPEFALRLFSNNAAAASSGPKLSLPAVDGPSVVLVTGGTGTAHDPAQGKSFPVAPGSSFFLCHRATIVLESTDSQADLTVVQAHVNK